MLDLLWRRLASAVPTLFAIATLTFVMMRLTPGGPFDRERTVPPEIQANLNHAYHLDEPLYQQYFRYLGDLARGDFGPSFTYKDFTATELVESGLPVSLQLGAAAMVLALVVGIVTGTLAAIGRGRWWDSAAMGFSMIGIIVPSFVMGPLLVLLLAVHLHLLPAGGWGNGHQTAFKIMPVIVLAMPQIAAITRLTRNSLIEALELPFIRTARAKGLPEWIVLGRHAVRAAILPVVSYLGPATAGIITGSVVVEQVFSIPGIGRYFVQAAINRDYTLVTAVVILFGALIIAFNLIVDVLYGVLDPRVGRR